MELDTWTAMGLGAVALIVVYCTHLVWKWKNPKVNGVLPPGNMGFPLIGETLQFLIRGKTLDVHPFFKKRMQKYGPVFKTSLVGRRVIVSTDREVNKYILSHEGKFVQIWNMDSFAKLFGEEGENKITAVGRVHSYMRSMVLNHFGAERLRERLLPKVENMICTNLDKWSKQGPVDVKQAISVMILNFSAAEIIGYDTETAKLKWDGYFVRLVETFITFPLKIPGTAFHKSLKEGDRMLKILREEVMERLANPEKRRGDFLDQIIEDMQREKFLTVDFISQLVLSLFFVTFETTSSALTLTFKFLAENPAAVEELRAENDEMIKKRENPNSPLTWEEYKSLTFTHMVINETLRIGNHGPGLFKEALRDFQVNGYTVPAGWTIMLVTAATQLDTETFEDPLTFNPWRWKELDQVTISKNFIPFGGGTRQCAGADYSKLIMATFLHNLVTKYSFTKVKGGEISRKPFLSFGDGIHIKFTPRN